MKPLEFIKIDTIFTIKKGEKVFIDNTLELKFSGHSHKSVMANGPKSPLMISLEYQEEDSDDTERKTYYKYDELPFIWRWKNYLFVVMNYKYGDFMEMKVSYDEYEK